MLGRGFLNKQRILDGFLQRGRVMDAGQNFLGLAVRVNAVLFERIHTLLDALLCPRRGFLAAVVGIHLMAAHRKF